MSSRPWFTVPANVSYNGKLLEEYPIEKLNNCFVTGIGINIKTVKWMSINFNCDYIGATFNYNYVVHSEDKMVTKVYDTDFKLRSYMLSAGIVLHTPFE